MTLSPELLGRVLFTTEFDAVQQYDPIVKLVKHCPLFTLLLRALAVLVQGPLAKLVAFLRTKFPATGTRLDNALQWLDE